jgi:TM2 domain-containing membrane protein YozV
MGAQAQIVAVKSTVVTYLLWILGGFGVLGLQRFYLGRWVSGLIWLFTGGVFMVGAIIDLFVIPEMVRVENLSRKLLQQAQGGWEPQPRPGGCCG